MMNFSVRWYIDDKRKGRMDIKSTSSMDALHQCFTRLYARYHTTACKLRVSLY